jgi:hypothetical protein
MRQRTRAVTEDDLHALPLSAVAAPLARSGVSVGCRPHRFGDDELLVRVRAVRICQALLGEDDKRRGCVVVLDDVRAVVVETTS